MHSCARIRAKCSVTGLRQTLSWRCCAYVVSNAAHLAVWRRLFMGANSNSLSNHSARLGGTQFETGRKLSARAHQLIPGGAHTYAKGDDQYPEQAPHFIA